MITVFTPAFNRAHVIHRVYDSLKCQTYRDFEWIIVDDGSSDDTEAVVQSFLEQDNFFSIRYFYQENQGKHIATNRAVHEANGEFFVTLDSDDGCKPNALERMLQIWNTVPEGLRSSFKGVSCRCCRPGIPDKIIGTHLPTTSSETLTYFDSNDHDLRFKHKVKGEFWGMTRRQVMLENPYPAIKGLQYYPEGVYWGKIGWKYSTRYFDEPLRYYYDDTANQLTNHVNANETYYAREYMLSEKMVRKYYWYNPLNFYMQAVGFVRDGLLTDRSVMQLFSTAGVTKRGWMLCLLGFLPGKILQLIEDCSRLKSKRK